MKRNPIAPWIRAWVKSLIHTYLNRYWLNAWYKKGEDRIHKKLVQWNRKTTEHAIWEDMEEIKIQFPKSSLEGEAEVEGKSIVTRRASEWKDICHQALVSGLHFVGVYIYKSIINTGSRQWYMIWFGIFASPKRLPVSPPSSYFLIILQHLELNTHSKQCPTWYKLEYIILAKAGRHFGCEQILSDTPKFNLRYKWFY